MFVRLGARYVEFSAENPFDVLLAEIIPIDYPLTEKQYSLSGLDGQIYKTSLRTLKLCMHEHYENCPWREQALYILNSQNQMLCGYYAFEESEFQRENLLFMSKGSRTDGMFALTFPSATTPAIPFFSKMYPVAVYEYVQYTGDTELIGKVFEPILKMMSFVAKSVDETGLIPNFGKPFWNFYEWSDGSDGSYEDNSKRYDLLLNCAYVYSVKCFKKICRDVGKAFDFSEEKMCDSIKKTFYSEEKCAFFASTANSELFTELGNAFAVLIGLGSDNIIKKQKDKRMQAVTLSMSCYVYDALLQFDKGNADYILDDIRNEYSYMLSMGATFFWETRCYRVKTKKTY